jgi:CDP-glucose 4,6-dehydratase
MEAMITDFDSVYRGKRIFVTGHTGFKGSWLVYWLSKLGAEVKGYALAPDPSNDLFGYIKGNELCTSVLADIRDSDTLKKEILDFSPDFIFHLAAQPLVRYSYDFPAYTFEVNAQGTINVLDALRFLKKPCVAVLITTDKVYENLETGQAYKETDRLGGYDPYSASKACAELAIDSYRNSFFNIASYHSHGKSVSVARAGNVIGGGDWATDRIVPDIIRSLVSDQSIRLRNPNSIRPWQHVLEPLEGYLMLGAKQHEDPIKFSTSYNFGPLTLNSVPVSVLAQKAAGLWGGQSTILQDVEPGAVHEAALLQLNIDKAVEELNWRPSWDFDKTLEVTVNWYKKYFLNPLDARNLMDADITLKSIK